MRAEQTYYVSEQDWKALKAGAPWTLVVGQAITHVVYENGQRPSNQLLVDDVDESWPKLKLLGKTKGKLLKITKGSGNGRHRTEAFKRKVVAFASVHSIQKAEDRYHVAWRTVKTWMKEYPKKGDA